MKRETTRTNSTGEWIAAIAIPLVAVLFFTYPMWANGPGRTKRSSDLSNIKQMGVALSIYMDDYDGFGPPPDQWMDALQPILKNEPILFSPVEDSAEGEYGYAYLRELETMRLSDVLNPESVPTVFNSSDLRRNASGSLDLLPDPPRWDEVVNNILFLDGHAKGYKTAPKFKIELP